MKIKTFNPAFEGQILGEYPIATNSQLDSLVEELGKRKPVWFASLLTQRQKLLSLVADLLQSQRQTAARQMAQEMGKPLREALAEIDKCCATLQYYAQEAHVNLATKEVESQGLRAQTGLEPLGLILMIMPWNFPLWQVVRVLAPNLALGNLLVLKPAEQVLGTTLAFAALVEQAANTLGLPNPMATAIVEVAQVQRLIEHPLIQGVTLTGSTQAGRAVARLAGENLKKVVLELGGSDPYLVLEDADVSRAAALCAQSRLLNNGQSCVGAKRFFVHKKRAKEFIAALKVELSKARLGDPLEDQTTLGPLVSGLAKQRLQMQVQQLRASGANYWEVQASVPTSGHFVPPGILQFPDLVAVPDQPWTEEIFGPVACLWVYADLDVAIATANATTFGLGGGVFSSDVVRAQRVAQRLECGMVAINDFVKSDPAWPFGGVKGSGFGRELGTPALGEFANVRTFLYAKKATEL